MKKHFIFLTAMLLLVGAVFAQKNETRSIKSPSKFLQATSVSTQSSTSRSPIYSEGFEETTGIFLPQGWLSIPSGIWETSDGEISGVENPQTAHTGDRFMVRSWNQTGYYAWAFTPKITLTAGMAYTINFWFRAPGYPGFNEYDDFEVKIGKTPSDAGMSDAYLLFSNITNRVNPWTLAECFFIPPTTGDYYIGFHCLNDIVDGSGTGIFIMIDDILVEEAACHPVMNFTVSYDANCTAATLAWEIADPNAEVTYQVLRDDKEIAVVETKSYIDTDFEPTLEHTWAVKVICNDTESSIAIPVYKDPCLATSCVRAKYLSVAYNDDCNDAKLQWLAPTDILWDNTAGNTMRILTSVRWMMETYSRAITADDFDVPAGETWYVSEVYFSGSHNPTGDPQLPPDFIGIEFYKNAGGKPGENILEEPYLSSITGDVSSFMTIILPEPLVLGPGKYWVSCYGVHDGAYSEKKEYFVGLCSTPRGETICFLDDESGEWESNPTDLPSMYFRIQGHKSNEAIEYNIYRDGNLIGEKITELEYSDNSFIPNAKHSWSVRVACPAGDQSPPIYGDLEACNDNAVNENVTIAFTIMPNPANDKINITSNNNFNKIEVINFLGQTVITQQNVDNNASIEIANLNTGIYFVRVFSENGTAIQKFVKQ